MDGDRRIHRELVTQLALERVHVERVQELERAASAAHVAAIDRWVSDNTRRAQRDEQALEALQTLRAAGGRVGALVPLDDDEEAAGVRVRTAAALISNQAQQALYASDTVGMTSDLELAMDTLRQQATAMTATVSRAGSSSDRRLAQLRGQQVAIEIAFVVTALAILTVAVYSRADFVKLQQVVTNLRQHRQAQSHSSVITKKRLDFTGRRLI